MTITRDDTHVFIGMNIFFPGDGTVRINMSHYLQEAIDEYKDAITRVATSPAKTNLFDIQETTVLLATDDKERFHSTVAKLLYVTHPARPDICLLYTSPSPRDLSTSRMPSSA